MRISVVIATYNRASLLEAALAQMCRQAFVPGDEVIVVDNGSTDRTPEVIAAAARACAVPLRTYRETEPGKTPALNTGVRAARGDILALTDDDVIVGDDWIATIRCIFRDDAIALVGGRVDPRWERTPPRWLRVEDAGRYNEMASPLALLHYGPPQPLAGRTAVGANIAVRRTVHDAVGGFAARLGRRRGTLLCGEDHDFCERVGAGRYRCEYRPELAVRHWVPANRMTLRYYARWFFWSGITNAMLERRADSVAPRHFVRRAVTASAAAGANAAAGRASRAAAEMMQAAFSVGYLYQRIKERGAGGLADRAFAQPGVDG